MGRGNRQQVFIDPRVAFSGKAAPKEAAASPIPEPEPEAAKLEFSVSTILDLFKSGSLTGVSPVPALPNDLLVARSNVLWEPMSPTNKEYQAVITVGKSGPNGRYPGNPVYKVIFYNGPGGKMKPQKHKEKTLEFLDLNIAMNAANNQLDKKLYPPRSKAPYSPKPINGVAPAAMFTAADIETQATANLTVA